MKGWLIGLVYRFLCFLAPDVKQAVETGVKYLELEQDDTPMYLREQTPHVVRKMGWAFIPYTEDADVRITITRSEEGVETYVDFRDYKAAKGVVETLAEAAMLSMEVADAIAKEQEGAESSADSD